MNNTGAEHFVIVPLLVRRSCAWPGVSLHAAALWHRASAFLPGKRQVWAIAPVINLSGQKAVDPILQADLVYQQMQQVHGLTLVPVNRVVEVMAGLEDRKGAIGRAGGDRVRLARRAMPWWCRR